MATKESFFESYDCFCSPKDVFLGPISEYVLAPVARFSRWISDQNRNPNKFAYFLLLSSAYLAIFIV